MTSLSLPAANGFVHMQAQQGSHGVGAACHPISLAPLQAGIREVVYHEAKGEARRSDSPITVGNFK